MSSEDIFDRWVISARVLVRSTNESRPSSAEIRSIDRCCVILSLFDALEEDSIDGT